MQIAAKRVRSSPRRTLMVAGSAALAIILGVTVLVEIAFRVDYQGSCADSECFLELVAEYAQYLKIRVPLAAGVAGYLASRLLGRSRLGIWVLVSAISAPVVYFLEYEHEPLISAFAALLSAVAIISSYWLEVEQDAKAHGL